LGFAAVLAMLHFHGSPAAAVTVAIPIAGRPAVGSRLLFLPRLVANVRRVCSTRRRSIIAAIRRLAGFS
jgi:hypothetical protein